MQRLTFRHRAHKVVFMLFYLNKVIFAVLDVSSLPLQKFQTSMEVFFYINSLSTYTKNGISDIRVKRRIMAFH